MSDPGVLEEVLLIQRDHGLLPALEDLGEAFEAQLDKDAAIKVMVSPAPEAADVRSLTAVDIPARHPA